MFIVNGALSGASGLVQGCAGGAMGILAGGALHFGGAIVGDAIRAQVGASRGKVVVKLVSGTAFAAAFAALISCAPSGALYTGAKITATATSIAISAFWPTSGLPSSTAQPKAAVMKGIGAGWSVGAFCGIFGGPFSDLVLGSATAAGVSYSVLCNSNVKPKLI